MRADREDRRAAAFPDEPPRLDQGFVVEHVERHDAAALGERLREPRIALPPLHGDEIDEADRLCGLTRQMAAEIGLVHGRDRMLRHGRMPVEPVAAPLRQREEMAEALETAHRRLADDERHPAVEQLRGEVDGAADAADLRRRVEGRADLVMDDRRSERFQEPEDRRQMPVHPSGIARARDAGDADAAEAGEGGEALGRRRRQEQHRLEAREGERLHGGRRAGEVVAVEGDERSVRQRARSAHAAISSARPSSGWVRACSSSGMPAIAASQATRSERTPAAGPSGWAMMPPPAVIRRSVDCRAA